MIPITDEQKLTQLSHGGGCGCKIAPALLKQLIAGMPHSLSLFPELLVGNETADDAAVYQLNQEQALIATTDFFMPIVDDPFDFGRIAAANALSDIYAMGGKPIMALAIVGMPIDKLSVDTIQLILKGGESICCQAGIPIAGGHSIDAPEPIYGLVALGLVHPNQLKRNSSAQAGDLLIMGKPLGIGILAHAIKVSVLSDAGYAQLIGTATQLNTIGSSLAQLPLVHALTDITGFGLAGHLLELCQGARVAAHIDFKALPILPEALLHAQAGVGPGAIGRNRKSFGEQVRYADYLAPWQCNLTLDPQTSGGLMAAVDPQVADHVLHLFHQAGFAQATVIGRLAAGDSEVHIH